MIADRSDVSVAPEISGFGTELVLPALANDQLPLAPCLSIAAVYPKQFLQDCYDEGFRMPADEMRFLGLGCPGVRKSLKEEPAGNGR